MIPGGIGRLRSRVTIRRLKKITEPFSGHVRVADPEVILKDIAASVEDASPTEIFKAAQVQTRLTHMITIRFRPGLDSEIDIVHRGKVFNVVGKPTNDEGRDEFLIFKCIEKGA